MTTFHSPKPDLKGTQQGSNLIEMKAKKPEAGRKDQPGGPEEWIMVFGIYNYTSVELFCFAS